MLRFVHGLIRPADHGVAFLADAGVAVQDAALAARTQAVVLEVVEAWLDASRAATLVLLRQQSVALAGNFEQLTRQLIDGGSLTTSQMAKVAGLSEAEVNQHLEQLKADKIFLGWRPVLDLSREAAAAAAVRAVIEVKVTPERGGGFNRFAERIARFDEVESCYLMSGGYDLLVFVRGGSLQKVAAFVSEKLSTVEGVLSTSTHFMLRCYKEQGFLLDGGEAQAARLNVAP